MDPMKSQKSLPPPTSSTDIPDVKLIETEVVRLDPRGLIKNDIEFIRSKLLPVEWNSDMTMEEIAYRQGKYDLLKFIEQKVVGRRLN